MGLRAILPKQLPASNVSKMFHSFSFLENLYVNTPQWDYSLRYFEAIVVLFQNGTTNQFEWLSLRRNVTRLLFLLF